MESKDSAIDLQTLPETSDKLRILIYNDDGETFNLIIWPGQQMLSSIDGNVEQVIEVDLDSKEQKNVVEALRLLSTVVVSDSIDNLLTDIVNSVWQRAREASKVE